MALLKNNIHINPAAWKSFDHHKDRLPGAVHDRLLREMEKAAHEVIPISLRNIWRPEDHLKRKHCHKTKWLHRQAQRLSMVWKH